MWLFAPPVASALRRHLQQLSSSGEAPAPSSDELLCTFCHKTGLCGNLAVLKEIKPVAARRAIFVEILTTVEQVVVREDLAPLVTMAERCREKPWNEAFENIAKKSWADEALRFMDDWCGLQSDIMPESHAEVWRRVARFKAARNGPREAVATLLRTLSQSPAGEASSLPLLIPVEDYLMPVADNGMARYRGLRDEQDP